eukprot:CAMPEP_0184695372 /NCGR_PEP_ID=MMETSP0313-20130426/3017_1 /TAXON_ID=2792 /ORGANISM="Porphyridium aerugineum, Strain SAG 1380-2" /LENGTH=671 /DNA_ID=CAMNT_0027153809 /DNA_START=637 /DNA_END=2652 /DNA_ORIENTATION=+
MTIPTSISDHGLGRAASAVTAANMAKKSMGKLTLMELKELRSAYEVACRGKQEQGLTRREFGDLVQSITDDPAKSRFISHAFDLFDVDGDGHVSLKEFLCGISILCHGTDSDRLGYMFLMFDDDESGDIDRDEFVNIIMVIQNYNEMMEELAAEMEGTEAPESNLMSRDEVEEIVDSAMQKIDIDGSGKVERNEFEMWARNSPVVQGWLDTVRKLFGSGLNSLREKKERELMELEMQRLGFGLNNSDDFDSDTSQVDTEISREASLEDKTHAEDVDTLASLKISDTEASLVACVSAAVAEEHGDNNSSTVPDSHPFMDGIQNKAANAKASFVSVYSNPSVPSNTASIGSGNGSAKGNISSSFSHESINGISMLSNFLIDYDALTLENEIGTGSFAKVYQGEWLQMPVAVKVFKTDIKSAPNATELIRNELLKECEVMSSLRHPNVLLYMGIVCADISKPLCMVSEYFNGGSLCDYLERNAFSEAKSLTIAIGIARGMLYLHNCKPPIIHRDLKTNNVLVKEDASQVVISDFGLSIPSQFTSEGVEDIIRASSDSGATMSLVGTPQTMAVEVMSGSPATTKSDVYSFGIMLWEIFTHKVAWEGLTPIQLMFQVNEGARPSLDPSECPQAANISPEIKALIEKCWAQEADDRPTFSAILKELSQIQKSRTAKK